MSADVVDASVSVWGAAFSADPTTPELIRLHVGIHGIANILARAVKPCTADVTCNTVVLSIPSNREVTRTTRIDGTAAVSTAVI